MTTLSVNSNVDCKLIKITNDFIFFEKGSGVHSVAQDFDETGTAANWLLSVDESLRAVSVPLESGLLHRLDFDTSGVMVAARHKAAFVFLKELFKKNLVTKEYVCLVSAAGLKPGRYEAYAYGRGKSSKKVMISLHRAPTSARKIVTVVKEVLNDRVTLQIETGFRHQIRAHLAFLGFPLLGDKLYGGDIAERLMLHAVKLEFIDNGKKMSVQSVFVGV